MGLCGRKFPGTQLQKGAAQTSGTITLGLHMAARMAAGGVGLVACWGAYSMLTGNANALRTLWRLLILAHIFTTTPAKINI
jgi:hypothetical protein